MIGKTDTVGVFQIESRAQMAMLPRFRPRNYFDLIVQIAIIRPGPIQGGMIRPLLRRRCGLEPMTYLSPEVEQVLAKTLGIPIFQEQMMRLAMVVRGFTGGEADELRRAMGKWDSAALHHFRGKLRDGILARGLPVAFAEQVFEHVRGFSQYGFPESHAASFALLCICKRLAQMPLSCGVYRSVSEFAADGILRSRATGTRCSSPRCDRIITPA